MKKKNGHLQILRGIALLMVFFSHYFAAVFDTMVVAGVDLNRSPLRLLWGGNAAVIVFFCLSGFFMYDRDAALRPIPYIKSVLRRWIRLYPLFAVTMALGIGLVLLLPYPASPGNMGEYILGFWTEKKPILNYLRQFLLIGGFDSTLVNPPIWTLIHEARFALLAPLFSFLIKRVRGEFVLLAVGVLGCVSSHFSVAFIFVLGMVARKALLEGNLQLNGKALKVSLGALAVLLLDFPYLMKSFGVSVDQKFVYLISSFGAVILLLLCYQARKEPPMVLKPLVKLGDISYAVYLVHHLLLIALRPMINLPVGFVVYGLLVLVASVVIGALLTKADALVAKGIRKKITWLYQ